MFKNKFHPKKSKELHSLLVKRLKNHFLYNIKKISKEEFDKTDRELYKKIKQYKDIRKKELKLLNEKLKKTKLKSEILKIETKIKEIKNDLESELLPSGAPVKSNSLKIKLNRIFNKEK